MSRLIDADDLIEVIKERRPLNWTDSESELQEDADYNHFIEMVNAQPTAYDVEKVVAALDKIRNYTDGYGLMLDFDNAIEIVLKGEKE